MDKSKLLELENKFILLKKEDKSFEQIAQLLPSVSKIMLKKWEKSYNNEVEILKKDAWGEASIILEKKANGKYTKQVNFLIDNQLDVIKLDMYLAHFNDAKVESLKQEHLKIFQDFIKSIRYEYDENKNGYDVTIILKNEDPIIQRKAQDAVQFYLNHLLPEKEQRKARSLLKEASRIYFNNFEHMLPYGIKQFKVENFQDIKNISLEHLPVDAKWIFLTGENSFGKTTLLQAIALSLTGEKREELKEENFAIELQNKNDSVILNYWHMRNFKPFPYLACYGASRLALQHDRSNNEIGEKSSLLYSLFHSDGVLLNIEIELYLWFIEKDTRFEETVMLFKKLIPTIDDIVVDRKDRKIYYIEKLSSNRLTNKQLGSGYKSLIAMIGDMMIRLFKTQPDITKPSDLAGIVLIDELDLHWHPKWQRRLPTLLSEIFPKVQFIASTHSEMPLLGAPENSIFLKVTRTLEEGVKVHKLDIDLSNLMPNHLLTSALFDMDFNDITAVTHKSKQDLRTEDTMQEIKKTDDVEAYLKDYATNNAKFPDDLFD